MGTLFYFKSNTKMKAFLRKNKRKIWYGLLFFLPLIIVLSYAIIDQSRFSRFYGFRYQKLESATSTDSSASTEKISPSSKYSASVVYDKKGKGIEIRDNKTGAVVRLVYGMSRILWLPGDILYLSTGGANFEKYIELRPQDNFSASTTSNVFPCESEYIVGNDMYCISGNFRELESKYGLVFPKKLPYSLISDKISSHGGRNVIYQALDGSTSPKVVNLQEFSATKILGLWDGRYLEISQRESDLFGSVGPHSSCCYRHIYLDTKTGRMMDIDY